MENKKRFMLPFRKIQRLSRLLETTGINGLRSDRTSSIYIIYGHSTPRRSSRSFQSNFCFWTKLMCYVTYVKSYISPKYIIAMTRVNIVRRENSIQLQIVSDSIYKDRYYDIYFLLSKCLLTS